MAQDKANWFRSIFLGMMIFTGLVWVWTVAFIISWPWEKNGNWKPEFRLVAVCQDKTPCGVAYGELADAKAKGLITTLVPPEPAGEVEEKLDWLKWTTSNGVIEAKASSWHFQTVVRYKVENETPVLVEYQDVTVKAFWYGLAAGAFSLIGIYLRKLRG